MVGIFLLKNVKNKIRFYYFWHQNSCGLDKKWSLWRDGSTLSEVKMNIQVIIVIEKLEERDELLMEFNQN